ncbi:MAG TPA: aspartate aminotransferase family protein [Methylomirabilota bacterium]|jgi:glutamate-1-semialdehyde 2,1-aminomutase|nr:aspartate aminotransferase family protein [Methylomirabilota bacterium]
MTSSALAREIERYLARTPRSRALQAEAAQVLPGGSSRGTAYFPPYPFFAESGDGHYVQDVDGNRYLDFMLNATSLIAGHANPMVIEALGEQTRKGTAFSTPTLPQIRLARLLCDRIPSLDTIRFTNSGTEGTLMAIRAAWAFTGKPKLAKFEGGYHGAHEHVAVSVRPPAAKLDPAGPTAIPEYPGQPAGVLEDVVVLPYNDLAGCAERLRRHRHEIGALIMEPIVSSFGYVPGEPEFLQGIRKLTEELGIVLIYDEVQSLRVAPGGAQELFGVTPDLSCFGKIIGGGLPVGAFGGRRDIMAQFDPTAPGGARVAHAGTFNANPMTLVAGEAVMRALTPPVYRRLAELGETLRARLRQTFAAAGVPAQVTGIASLFGMHFGAHPIRSYRDVVAGDAELTKCLYVGLLNEGILLQTSGAGALGIMTTETEIDALVAAVGRVLARIRA